MRYSEFNIYGFKDDDPKPPLKERAEALVYPVSIDVLAIYKGITEFFRKKRYSQVPTDVIKVDFDRRRKDGYL